MLDVWRRDFLHDGVYDVRGIRAFSGHDVLLSSSSGCLAKGNPLPIQKKKYKTFIMDYQGD
jgi:hypothetical protein